MSVSKTNTCYKVCHGSSGTLILRDKHSFDTKEEAIEATKEFKANPKVNNKNMTDRNAEYWKNETYTVREEILTVTDIEVI